MTNKRAIVVNGNKAFGKRVFLIRGARIVKSWDIDYYLKTPLRGLKSQVLPRHISPQRYT